MSCKGRSVRSRIRSLAAWLARWRNECPDELIELMASELHGELAGANGAGSGQCVVCGQAAADAETWRSPTPSLTFALQGSRRASG